MQHLCQIVTDKEETDNLDTKWFYFGFAHASR